jgi:hypothetical protein
MYREGCALAERFIHEQLSFPVLIPYALPASG